MSFGERETRIQKMKELESLGILPYSDKFLDKTEIKNLMKIKDIKSYEQLENSGASKTHKIAGRIISIREHGKLIFMRLSDISGEIQLALVKDKFTLQNKDDIDAFEFTKRLLDMGDFIGVYGDLFMTKHGELTLFVAQMKFLSKTIRPMPEKFHGIGEDKESRYRYRYLDLIASDEQGEQTGLNFLKNDKEFRNFYLSMIGKEQEWTQNVQNVIKFRVEKLGEEQGLSVLQKIVGKNYEFDEKEYNYLFDIFVKSNKVRDLVLAKMQDKLPAQYLAAKFRINTKSRFLMRTKTISFIRNYLEDNGFIEVETPVLCNKASGAMAKPFSTKHNAYDMDVYLRIAPETYLKRAVVGGFEKVYEFARCFRNEGIDPSHIQDFTMLEFYWTYVDYDFLMDFTEKMFKDLIKQVYGNSELIILDKQNNPVKVDFDKPWPRVSIFDLIKPYLPELETLWQEDKLDEAKKIASEKLKDYLDTDDQRELHKLGWGNLIDFVYKKTARKKLIDPVFVINHPIELSPLARKNDNNNKTTDRFQLVVNGWEIVNAYSELVDPVDQMQRFIDQQQAKDQGDEEAHGVDHDYVRAMEHGMPPIAGWGSGIDRLVALLTTQENIRDVVMFPLTKPLHEDE